MEVKLAEKMGVSRTPVREAIRKLELEGLVDMIPRKGAHVADLSVKDIVDVLEVRASLDGLAALLAAERITDEEINELRHVNSQFVSFLQKENLQGSIKKDVEFHEIIYRSSRNEKLIQIVSNLREQVQRFRVIYLKDYVNPKELEKEHKDICDAIFSRNGELSRKAAQSHIKSQQESIISAVRKVNLGY
jgi:DNA-binding GntR family transcriptional regulator